MVFLHINPTNYNVKHKSKMTPIEELNKCISSGKQIFMLIYKEGCPPCIATRPEWAKIYSNPEVIATRNIVVVDIDKDLTGHIHNLKKEPLGYPTMRYITNGGETYEDYEDSPIQIKDRSIDSFVDWIKTKTNVTGDKPNPKRQRKNPIRKKTQRRKSVRRKKNSYNTKRKKSH
jgi:hypothetical protein